MFLVFIKQTFLLYLIPLVHSFHSAQHTTPFSKAVKLCQYSFFHQVSKFFQDE